MELAADSFLIFAAPDGDAKSDNDVEAAVAAVETTGLRAASRKARRSGEMVAFALLAFVVVVVVEIFDDAGVALSSLSVVSAPADDNGVPVDAVSLVSSVDVGRIDAPVVVREEESVDETVFAAVDTELLVSVVRPDVCVVVVVVVPEVPVVLRTEVDVKLVCEPH